MSRPPARTIPDLELAIESGQRLARYWWGQGDRNFAYAHMANVLGARAELDRLKAGANNSAHGPAEENCPEFDEVLIALELLRLRAC